MLVLDKSDLYTTVSYVPKTSVEGIPSGAVIGGRTADNFPLYIVQMTLSGNLDIRNNYGEYHKDGGGSGFSTEWDYMVVVYSKYCHLHSNQQTPDLPLPLLKFYFYICLPPSVYYIFLNLFHWYYFQLI